MGTGDESGDREPLHFIHKYISHELEPDLITESPLDLSPMENIAFRRSLGASVSVMTDDESYSEINHARQRSREIIRKLYGEIHSLNRNIRRLIDNGINPEDVIQYHLYRTDDSLTEDERAWIRSSSDLGNFYQYTYTLFALKQSERVLPFLALSQVLIEDYSVEIIEQKLINDQYSGSNTTIEFLEELSQPTREQIMQRTGLLDGHVVSDLVKTRETRNDVVHGLHSSDFLDFLNESLPEFDKCIDVIIEMESIVEPFDMFGWTWRAE